VEEYKVLLGIPTLNQSKKEKEKREVITFDSTNGGNSSHPFIGRYLSAEVMIILDCY